MSFSCAVLLIYMDANDVLINHLEQNMKINNTTISVQDQEDQQ